MRRRQFLGYTGLTASAILMGGVLNPAEVFAGRGQRLEHAGSKSGIRIRMNGGRCRDHRFLDGDPKVDIEREIFGF